MLVQPAAALPEHAAAAVAHVEQDPEAARVAGLAQRFTALIRCCGIQSAPSRPLRRARRLDRRGAHVRHRGHGDLAARLGHDIAAVCAALTTPWSNGQAEGQINRLKLIKRQSYGRAGFELMRRRALHAP